MYHSIVLNKPSINIHGETKVEKMIRDGLRYLRSKGRQISDDDEKYIKDNYSDVLISKGEIVIQPELADVLGRKRLLAINERGKRRVSQAQKKQEEYEKFLQWKEERQRKKEDKKTPTEKK